MLVARDVPRTRMVTLAPTSASDAANCPAESRRPHAGADRAHSACFRQASAIEHSLPHETVGSTCLQLRASDPRGDDYRTAAGVGRQGIEP